MANVGGGFTASLSTPAQPPGPHGGGRPSRQPLVYRPLDERPPIYIHNYSALPRSFTWPGVGLPSEERLSADESWSRKLLVLVFFSNFSTVLFLDLDLEISISRTSVRKEREISGKRNEYRSLLEFRNNFSF